MQRTNQDSHSEDIAGFISGCGEEDGIRVRVEFTSGKQLPWITLGHFQSKGGDTRMLTSYEPCDRGSVEGEITLEPAIMIPRGICPV